MREELKADKVLGRGRKTKMENKRFDSREMQKYSERENVGKRERKMEREAKMCLL